MTILLTILHVAVCLILIVVILVQGGRGQGLSGPSFSSGNVQSLFGTQAADFLTKATSVAAILFLFTCLGLNLYESHKSKSLLGGGRQTAPVDIDAVKKALEKIKAEGTNASPDAKNQVNALVQDAQKAAASAANSASAAADNAVKQAVNAASDVKNQAVNTAADTKTAVSAAAQNIQQNAANAVSDAKNTAATAAAPVSDTKK